MPKPKPTEIIRHELVLGRKEMELVENALVYPSIVGSIKDLLPYVKDAATAIALIEGIATIAEMAGIKTPIPTPVDLVKWLEENGYTFNAAKNKWEAAQTGYDAYQVGGLDLGSVITGDIIEENLPPGVDPCDLSLAGQLAFAGYPPTTANFVRYFLFGPLPGMPECGGGMV
jgi:hypothetical protein